MWLSTPAFVLGLAFCVIVTGVAHTQPISLEFERISVEAGLPDYVVMALERDATGFLWVGTQGGLGRYDGARVRSFTHIPDVEASLPNNYIRAQEEDPTEPGVLWVGTNGGGLGRFDPVREQFTRFTTNAADASAISSNTISVLFADTEGHLWIGTTNAGLNRYHPETNTFEVWRNVPGEINSLVDNTILAIYEPPSTPGTLWIGTQNGLTLFDTKAGRFEHYISDPQDPTTLSHGTVTAFAEAGGFVWCSTIDGVLHRFDQATRQFQRYGQLSGVEPLESISVLVASRHDPTILWIGTRGQGLIALNVDTMEATQFTRVAGEPTSLSRADVLTLVEDDDGLLWVGTTAGVNKASLHGKRFTPYGYDPESADTLSTPTVLTLYEAPSEPDVVWIGTERGGLNRFDRKAGTYTHYFTAPDHPLNLVLAIHEDRLGQLWLGRDRRDLYLLDRITGAFSAYPLASGIERLIVKQIYEAPSLPGILWVATRGLGLVRFESRTRQVQQYYTTNTSEPAHLSSNHIWFVQESPDERGILWIATHDGGLNRLDIQSDSVTVYRRETSCLPSNSIVSIAFGEPDILWLGTFDDGLVRFNSRTTTCETYTLSDGLPYMRIGITLADRHRHLWLGTGNGLIRFNPLRKTFTRFTEADGLQGNIFHFQAQHQNARGELFMGGANGFNIFHPDSITIRERPPEIRITEIVVGDKMYLFREKHDRGEPIRLHHTENDITFRFATSDLTRPSTNRYKVRLAPDDSTWDLLDVGVSHWQGRLEPGKYTFEVRGTNSDGIWSLKSASIVFIIVPPLWQRWWFWGLVAGFSLGLVIVVYQYRIYQLRVLDDTRQRIADDLHDDIGSKISNIALRLDLAGRRRSLRDEERTELVELSQIARGVVINLRDTIWIVDAKHDSLLNLAIRMEQVAEQMLRGHRYTFATSPDLPDIALHMEQRRHVFLVFKEALHNAVRHSQAPNVDISLDYADGQVLLTVKDNGIGFDTHRVQGDGRGLKTMKSRAVTLQGNLDIDSIHGEGTTVQLHFPIR